MIFRLPFSANLLIKNYTAGQRCFREKRAKKFGGWSYPITRARRKPCMIVYTRFRFKTEISFIETILCFEAVPDTVDAQMFCLSHGIWYRVLRIRKE